MTNKVFVGNLSFQLSDFELEDLFKGYGKVVSAKVIVDRRTGRSRGYGFVEMDTENTAQQAIDALNGTEVKGRPINVSFAKEQTNDRNSFNSGYSNDSSEGNYQRKSYNNNY